jgi:hypothetical protein
MYSGDPVSKVGWVNTTARDQRQMTNTGPFQLVKDSVVTIVVAYIVGQGTDYLNSVTVVKTTDATAKTLFKANFPSLAPPPAVEYSTQTGDGFIDITWPTYKNIRYRAINKVFDVDQNIHGFFITQYFTNAKSAVVNNQPNSAEIARYDLKDAIQNIFYKVPNGGIDLREPSAPDANKLDSAVVADSVTGRIKFRLTNDPSTGNSLIKGNEYYFTITEYTVNNLAVVERSSGKYGPTGDYYDASGNAVSEFESPLITVTMNTDEYRPVTMNTPSKRNSGSSSGGVKYIVVDQTKLTGNTYKVDFVTDKNPLDGMYTPSWSLINTNTGTGDTLLKNQTVYSFDTLNYGGAPIQGFVPKVEPLIPEFGAPTYTLNGKAVNDTAIWYTAFGGTTTWRGVFYMGKDIPAPTAVVVGVGYNGLSVQGLQSNVMTADRMRQVEIHFGDTCLAYRYINGILGTIANTVTYYAGSYVAADTVKAGNHIGNWDAIHGHANGFVKVPFSAWVVDSANSEKRQLAVAFIEKKASTAGGNPDGNWDPGTKLAGSWEVILVFDSPYDTVPHIEYTGNLTATPEDRADVIKGYTLTGPYSDSLKKIALSPWFNTMYLAALERTGANFFTPGEHLTIPMVTYPYTSKDEFQFNTKLGNLSDADKKSLFDKVNVFPNPLYGYNPQTSYNQGAADEPFVTFSNLPGDVTINIFTLSGTRIRTLTTKDKSSPTSPFLRWNLQNESGLRAASGMYLAIVSSPGYGNKVLKFAIIMPQKQIKSY